MKPFLHTNYVQANLKLEQQFKFWRPSEANQMHFLALYKKTFTYLKLGR